MIFVYERALVIFTCHRHLVLNKDAQDVKVKGKKQDKIRYQYDEHYFLTDPDEFIQEFWAQDPEWQVRVVTCTYASCFCHLQTKVGNISNAPTLQSCHK